MSELDVSGFLGSFFDEAKERLVSINRRLVLLESGKLDAEGLTLLRRDAHTIKGSAQMLGVQDISNVSHLFEDAIEFAVNRKQSHAPEMAQFLFDLHDQLKDRLQYVDGESRLDTNTLQQRFHALCETLGGEMEKPTQSTDAQIESSEPSPPAEVSQPKPRRRKKRAGGGVNRNLIAAVMGTIEGSLESKKPEPVKTVEAEAVTQAAKPAVKEKTEDAVEQTIAFRPEVSQLDQKNNIDQDVSGNFQRVDAARISRLSNQILELSSDRYRGGSMENELETLLNKFKILKPHLFESASDRGQGTQGLKLEAAFDQQLRDLNKFREELRAHQRRSASMLDDLRDQVMDLMLKPLSTVFSLFPRTVRDLASQHDKKVQLLISGDAVEMDQISAEALREPLVHLINNAIAHGIESPEQRLSAGKTDEGQITISAVQKGSNICIEVIDDGNGIDIDKIRETALANGLITETEASEMKSSELLELIFSPGFSTQGEANSVAGRGMGMSIVMDSIRELTGTIHLQTNQGQGSKFILTIPTKVAIQKARVCRIGNQQFGVLANLIETTLPFSSQTIKKAHGAYRLGYIDYEQHRVPIVDLYQVVRSKGKVETASILIVQHMEGYLGIIVDELLDESEIIIRDLDPYLKSYHPIGIQGNAIIDDGSVLLLIDPKGLKEMWSSSPEYEVGNMTDMPAKFSHKVLLVDDSSIALEIERRLFIRLGFKVDTAVGGANALEKLQHNSYDLLVTDVEMPEINGLELIGIMRLNEKTAELPALVIATRETDEDKQQAILAGADGYIVKRELKEGLTDLANTLKLLLKID